MAQSTLSLVNSFNRFKNCSSIAREAAFRLHKELPYRHQSYTKFEELYQECFHILDTEVWDMIDEDAVDEVGFTLDAFFYRRMSPVTWKTIPGFSRYEASELGEIRNQKTGRVLKTRKMCYKNRRQCSLTNDQGQNKTLYLARAVCAAKEGRWPEAYEHTCHIDGDCTNDRMDNLRFADIVNNAIDEIDIGRKETSKQHVDLAIERLLALREQL